MRIKSSKIALSAAALITTALVLSGCSSSDSGDAAAENGTSETTVAAESTTDAESTTAASGTLADGSAFTGERITLVTGTDPDAPVISVSLPSQWTHSQEGVSGTVTDILSSNQPEASGFTPNTTLTVEAQGTATTDEVLAGARDSLATLNGWSEVKKIDLDIEGQKAIRVAGTWTPPELDVPIYAVMTVIAYQADASSPVYLVSFANQFTDTQNMAMSNQVEEINTSIEFG
ncbi:LpqN/LpqT family lipoprotein [Rhodococcus sp. IEGM 1379]|uniref:LpqN/LpqT family lipoprotein n=1 Tax=Rhodococcus sp. IEGM 1379 TaxID=3047086 RepID=UPI0024B7FC41|nr:LpqN/LpqT family lipoprotein [Rhodococcus sp. IEGM 1379]MDI9917586.1 LpqN/LpqT family lipoprotein [Rhodococcus sp. IEGM 1379]